MCGRYELHTYPAAPVLALGLVPARDYAALLHCAHAAALPREHVRCYVGTNELNATPAPMDVAVLPAV